MQFIKTSFLQMVKIIPSIINAINPTDELIKTRDRLNANQFRSVYFLLTMISFVEKFGYKIASASAHSLDKIHVVCCTLCNIFYRCKDESILSRKYAGLFFMVHDELGGEGGWRQNSMGGTNEHIQ